MCRVDDCRETVDLIGDHSTLKHVAARVDKTANVPSGSALSPLQLISMMMVEKKHVPPKISPLLDQ